DPEAVAKIFEAKGRPRFDPLIVHVADVAGARALVEDFPEVAERLAAAFWPGPLTLVMRKKRELRVPSSEFRVSQGEAGMENSELGTRDAGLPAWPGVPDLVTAGLGTVAVRVPAHPVALALLRRAGVPVAAPSANRFGGVSPTR